MGKLRGIILSISLILGSTVLAAPTSYSEDYVENSLKWPSPVRNNIYKFGPLLHQYQKFPGSAHYFHEGVDLLGDPDQKVFTPVSGIIDGGYYSYKENEDGTGEKTYLSLNDIPPGDSEPKLWGDNYFEISITDEFGYRFEFHHINKSLLPANILEAIKNSSYVLAGMQIGNILKWPRKVLGANYSHIHYSIVSPEGTQLNPFWFSEKITDEKPPAIANVYFQLKKPCPESGRVKYFSKTSLSETDEPTHLLINAKDFLGDNHFPHAPTAVQTSFSNGDSHIFDFRYSMMSAGQHLNINDVYVNRICIGDPAHPFILKASKNFDFYIKVPLPEKFSGSAEISIFDYAGNETTALVNIKN